MDPMDDYYMYEDDAIEQTISEQRIEEEIISESMSQWTPITELIIDTPIEKKPSVDDRIDICYVTMSDSAMLQHALYLYPPVENPGIEEALLGPDIITEINEDDSQELYLYLCSEMDTCPVRLFYRNLLNSEIDLSYYGVDPKGVCAMAKTLQNNKNVTRLDLTDNVLCDDSCYHLGEMLKSNTAMKELILTGCRIGASGLLCLGNNLSINCSLKILNISRNALNDDGGVVFANFVTDGIFIEKVILSKNNLGKEAALALGDCFECINQLTHLDLSWNNFNDVPSTVQMLNKMTKSVCLKEINLSFCALEGERVAEAIFNMLAKIPELEVLDLSYNRFEGAAIKKIIPGLIKATKLKVFDLSNNPMSPKDAYAVLEKMLRPRVKLETLLMNNVSVDKIFLTLLGKVKRMVYRETFTVTYGDVLQFWTIKGQDPRKLLLKRAFYVCKKQKRRKVDILMYFLNLHKEIKDVILSNVFGEHLHRNKIPLNPEFLKEFSLAFAGPLSGRYPTVDLPLIVDFINRLWPEKKLPITPPPEPEPEPKPILLLKKKKTGTKHKTVTIKSSKR